MKLSDAARGMAKKGIPASDIANILDLPIESVIAMGVPREIGRTNLDEVSSAMEAIVWLVYDEAKRVMTVGSPMQKNFLMRLVIGHLMRTMAVQTPTAIIDMQEEFHTLMQAQARPLNIDEIEADLEEAWVEEDMPE
jgi:hypothetical protein